MSNLHLLEFYSDAQLHVLIEAVSSFILECNDDVELTGSTESSYKIDIASNLMLTHLNEKKRRGVKKSLS